MYFKRKYKHLLLPNLIFFSVHSRKNLATQWRLRHLDVARNIWRCLRDNARIFFPQLRAKGVARRGCAGRWLISVWWICMRERRPRLWRMYTRKPAHERARIYMRIRYVVGYIPRVTITPNPLRILRCNPRPPSLRVSPRRILRVLRELFNDSFPIRGNAG